MMNRITRYMTLFWVGVGGERRAFSNLASAVAYLNLLRVGVAHCWLMGRHYGFQTPTHRVSLYKGDRQGHIVSALLPDERVEVEEGLLEQFA